MCLAIRDFCTQGLLSAQICPPTKDPTGGDLAARFQWETSDVTAFRSFLLDFSHPQRITILSPAWRFIWSLVASWEHQYSFNFIQLLVFVRCPCPQLDLPFPVQAWFLPAPGHKSCVFCWGQIEAATLGDEILVPQCSLNCNSICFPPLCCQKYLLFKS